MALAQAGRSFTFGLMRAAISDGPNRGCGAAPGQAPPGWRPPEHPQPPATASAHATPPSTTRSAKSLPGSRTPRACQTPSVRAHFPPPFRPGRAIARVVP